jgi:biofilm protein TabA
MILDLIRHARAYASLHPGFAAAFAWHADPAHRQLPVGRHPVCDGVDALIDEGLTVPASQRRFESHRRHIDIQIPLVGDEGMQWLPVHGLSIAEDFRPDGDVRFYDLPTPPAPLPPLVDLAMTPERFAIFFPQDAHRAACAIAGAPTPYRKIVFKVAIA